MKPASRRLAGSALYFIGLLLLLNLTTPALYRLLPNDYSRTRTLLDVARSPGFRPNTVVFGNSRAMSGINAQILRDSLGNPEIFNFATLGQSLGESALFYPLLPPTTMRIIQCLDLQGLVTNSPPALSEDKIRVFNMYGHRIAPTADSLFGNCMTIREQAPFIRNVAARGFVKAGISVAIKTHFDKGEFRDSLQSIIFPYLYSCNTSPYFKQEFAFYNKSIRIPSDAMLNAGYIRLLNHLNEYLKARNIQYVLVIMPLSPDLDAMNSSTITPLLAALGKNLAADIQLIDQIQLLDADAFYDGSHLNRKGARQLSTDVAAQLIPCGTP